MLTLFCFACQENNNGNKKLNINYETIIDSSDKEFSKTWKEFSNAIIQNDKATFRKLSVECIYCTECVTNTNLEDSLFNIFRENNNEIWYDTLYNRLSFISIDKFIAEDYNIIFTETVQKQLSDNTKMNALESRIDNIVNIPYCLKKELTNNYPQKKEVLITFNDKLENGEGWQIALDFIKTKDGYKFSSYSTIP